MKNDSPLPLRAFLSYQTADKDVAGQLKKILAEAGITPFLAHEDIVVSEEWRGKILQEIGLADIFIALLSNNYFESKWCVQESGIAAYRGVSIIPLSLDGTIPKGFINSIQSAKIERNNITIRNLLPGLLKHDFDFGIRLITDLIKNSNGFRVAESNFGLILPHIPQMTPWQINYLLECAEGNGQVRDASLCGREYLPPLLANYGHLLDRAIYTSLKKACEQYE